MYTSFDLIKLNPGNVFPINNDPHICSWGISVQSHTGYELSRKETNANVRYSCGVEARFPIQCLNNIVLHLLRSKGVIKRHGELWRLILCRGPH